MADPTKWGFRYIPTAEHANALAYSGAHVGYDGSGRKVIALHGGGHSGNIWNTWWAGRLDDLAPGYVAQFQGDPAEGPTFDALMVANGFDPSNNPIRGGSSVPFLSPSGRSYVKHTYDLIKYYAAFGGWLDHWNARTMLYRMPDTWETLSVYDGGQSHPNSGDVHDKGLLDEDPDHPNAALVLVTGGGMSGLHKMSASTRRWQQIAGNYGFQWSSLYSCYVPPWRGHLLSTSLGWYRLDSRTLVSTPLSNIPLPGISTTFAYSPSHQSVIFVKNGVYALDCAGTGGFTQLPLQGPVPNLNCNDSFIPLLLPDSDRGRLIYIEFRDASGSDWPKPTRTFSLSLGDLDTSSWPPPPSGGGGGGGGGTMQPTGFFDTVDANGHVVGWAMDANNRSAPVTVDIVIDGALAASVLTTVDRPDVNAAMGSTGAHGFDWEVTSNYRDGAPHTLVVQLAGTQLLNAHNGQSQPDLSPATFTLSGGGPPPPPPPADGGSASMAVLVAVGVLLLMMLGKKR